VRNATRFFAAPRRILQAHERAVRAEATTARETLSDITVRKTPGLAAWIGRLIVAGARADVDHDGNAAAGVTSQGTWK
jgi:hypothetical protein